ncbi:hypothetical protein Daus18300_002706 [Diaporthe australafricana]|uniref:Peptidase M20 dimerisation domain-containing protein n=1 Tax=Diaporthe australafricana TaxID=127596 RepID=A0ABR3XLV4_9PEZI
MRFTKLAALGLPLWSTVAQNLDSQKWKHTCPQPERLVPETSEKLSELDEYLDSDKFLKLSVERLSGAVQIDTTSESWWQDLPGKDPVWKHMSQFRKYLKKTFPLIRRHLDLDRVNEHGLIYTWKGTDSSLKPSLFLAHQDVIPVPAETVSEWEHPPFSGYFDGTYIWGRGSIDCKTTLIASMSAIESLLKVGYKPRRTVILAFGFDEEISGIQGAKRIAQQLEKRHGKNGVALLIDEGSGIVHHKDLDTIYAIPGLAEKGIFNANVSVHMESGHSALSTGSNSITVMADLIAKISASPIPGQIQPYDPFLETVFCLGQHVPPLRQKFNNYFNLIDQNEAAINYFVPTIKEKFSVVTSLIENTHTFAMIHGGYKINVVPERTSLSINHRLLLGTSVEQAKSHLEQIVKTHVAEINTFSGGPNLTFIGWSGNETINSVKLTELPWSLEPSPVTPFSVDGTTPYSVLQGTTRDLYDDSGLTLVAPISMPANTDSRHYWNLTQHIFRFSPGHDMTDESDNQILSGAHKNNERVNIFGHVNGVKWYSSFIRNMDEADLP